MSAATVRRIEFGYNPPSGQRGVEQFEPDPRTFVRDLQQALDVASQSFSSFWVSDHLMTAEPFRMECWTQLTWIAARYPGQMLGHIVLANSFRQPSLTAKIAATLQAFSQGRLILGYGAGWLEREYRAYGYEFPSPAVRIAQMVEGIQIIRAMWREAPASFEGRYYTIDGAFCEPRPERTPPIMIGGDGEKLTLRAVAEHADWWNAINRPLPVLRQKIDTLEAHCRDVGRDPATIKKTLSRTVFLKRDRAEAEAWAGSRLQEANPPFAGEPVQLVEHLQELADLGFDQFQMVFAGFPDTTDLRLFVDEVMPWVA
jgi:alkanesulfonate monooxygenase SsuD/methylene tetrahydromethanopterin reductase-like flavin-dependent oxidoreductase (luciferase family)